MLLCKCGAQNRANQRNCASCHRLEMKRTRLKQRSRLDRLQLVLDQMTVRNTVTEQAYRARFCSVFVILSDLVPAVVTGYFPSGMVPEDVGGRMGGWPILISQHSPLFGVETPRARCRSRRAGGCSGWRYLPRSAEVEEQKGGAASSTACRWWSFRHHRPPPGGLLNHRPSTARGFLGGPHAS